MDIEKQVTMFMPEAELNRDQGIAKAEYSALCKNEDWYRKAFDILNLYIALHSDPFLAEDVRNFAEGQKLEIPPSKRAWGSVFLKASKNGVIRKVGYARTSNPKAHKTPATLWEAI